MVDGQVVGDGKQPGLDLPLVRIVRIEVGQRALEYRCRQVVGSPCVCTAKTKVAKERRVVTIESAFEQIG